jgi:excisionase family DNA binding protein
VGDEKATMLIAEVAKELRISKTKAYEMVHKGELPVVRVGRNIRVPRILFESWLTKEAK